MLRGPFSRRDDSMNQYFRLTAVSMACGILCGMTVLPAQAAEEDFGIWGIFSTTDAFPSADGNNRWQYWFDAQARYFDIGSGINQYVIRPGVGYAISDNMSVWAGYGRFRTSNRVGDVSNEDRLWQQLSWNVARTDHGVLSMRARLEQRSVSTGDDLGWRLRYMAKYVRPLGSTENLDLILSIEPFFDLRDTDWGGDAGLSSNRTAIALGWKLSPKLAMETGYMHQYIWVDNAANRINHIGAVNFKMKF
jgi:hypothetical protein